MAFTVGMLSSGSGVRPRVIKFTNSGTWVVPTNVEVIWVTGIAGGGGGGGGGGGYGGGGGGGGSGNVCINVPLRVQSGETLTITIGAGGSGGSGGNGGSGGDTIITELLMRK
jgi:hypothetical protein